MKIPDIIYLQLDEDGEPGTWCADKINESDIAYTRIKPDGTQANPFPTLGEAIAHCSTDGPGKVVWWAFNPNSSITLLEEIEDDSSNVV